MDYKIKDLNLLGSIDEIKKVSQGFALIEAIIMPDWEYRYFSFNSNWDGNRKEAMASMRDGSGNKYFLHFSEFGTIGKVFFEGKKIDSLTYIKGIPDEFSSFKSELAFDLENTTFFLWKLINDEIWKSFPKNLEEFPLIGFLAGGIDFYHSWAENYYEKNININVLKKVFNSLNINEKQLKILNSEITLEILSEDFFEITGKHIN